MAEIDNTLKFCNAALVRASVSVLSDFESAKGLNVKALFDAFQDEVLALAFWRFNTGTRQLVALSETPEVRWGYQFQLPADRLDYPKAVYDSATASYPTGEYELGEDRLYGDFEACWVWYQRRPSHPGHWGVSMRAFAIVAFAARLALALNEDHSRYRTLTIEAYGSLDVGALEGLLGIAIQKEALASPPEQAMPDGGPLLAARNGAW